MGSLHADQWPMCLCSSLLLLVSNVISDNVLPWCSGPVCRAVGVAIKHDARHFPEKCTTVLTVRCFRPHLSVCFAASARIRFCVSLKLSWWQWISSLFSPFLFCELNELEHTCPGTCEMCCKMDTHTVETTESWANARHYESLAAGVLPKQNDSLFQLMLTGQSLSLHRMMWTCVISLVWGWTVVT